MHHTDRGSQYASEQFQRLMCDDGIACSMSRAGDCWDHAAMESFFSPLTTERTARKTYRAPSARRRDFFFLLGLALQSTIIASPPHARLVLDESLLSDWHDDDLEDRIVRTITAAAGDLLRESAGGGAL